MRTSPRKLDTENPLAQDSTPQEQHRLGCDPGFRLVSVAKSALDMRYIDAALALVAKADFDESQHPRASNGEFGAGGGGAKPPPLPKRTGGDVPFADARDVKEVKPKKPRQKPVPFANPNDVKEVKPRRASGGKGDAAIAAQERREESAAALNAPRTKEDRKLYRDVNREHNQHTDKLRDKAALLEAQGDHQGGQKARQDAANLDMHFGNRVGNATLMPDFKQRVAAYRSDHLGQNNTQEPRPRAPSAQKPTDSQSGKAPGGAQNAPPRAQAPRDAKPTGSIGATQSGKNIEASASAKSVRHYGSFTAEDHRDAAAAHKQAARAAQGNGTYDNEYHATQAKAHMLAARKLARAGVTKADAQALAYTQAAYDLQAPAAAYAPDADKVPAQAIGLMQANRLVAGMDAEMATGATNPDDARRRASRALVERPGLYDGIGATPRTDKLDGLQLDLGSGTARAPGHIGLDLGTFGDYGNAIHDLNLGLGEFPDGSVKAVRLVNSLHDILGDDGDPVALLLEIQRVMCEGGQLTYVGPEPLYEDQASWPCPALLLVGEQGTPASVGEDGVGAVRQVFERVPPRVPAYHGADADYQAAGPLPIDVAMALAAYNTAPSRLAMANLVNKSELVHKVASRIVKIAKTDEDKRIVLGVVLEGGTADAQGDVMTDADIEEAAHGYLGTSRVIGSEHGAPIEAHPVESYIAPQDFEFSGPDGTTLVKKGSWVLGVKISDPEEWAKVRQNGYNAFSVGGFGIREDLA